MPYKSTWLIKDEIILIKPYGIIELDELLARDPIHMEMIEQSPKSTVHCVFDNSLGTGFPKLNGVIRQKALGHPRLGWFIVTPTPRRRPGLMMIASVVASLFRMSYQAFDEPEIAFRFLKGVDRTLPDVEVMLDAFEKTRQEIYEEYVADGIIPEKI